MRKVLVTGASGFVGSRVVESLQRRGFAVHAVSRSSRDTSGNMVWHRADLLDEADAAGLVRDVAATHWLHLCWYTEPAKYWHAAENLHWVATTMRMAEQFRAAGGRRIVVAGSCAEYDWSYGYFREDATPLSPRTTYGRCKHALHELLQAFAASYDLELAWGRIFHVFGPHERPDRLIPSIVLALLGGRDAVCTHGDLLRDFLHVADVAEAFAHLVDIGYLGAVNICSGIPVAIRSVAEIAAAQLGARGRVRYESPPASDDQPQLIVGDNRKLVHLGWRPKFGLIDGVEDTVRWWVSSRAVLPGPPDNPEPRAKPGPD
jgi:nucleoside-diphosphate-sugar epimerase